MADNLTTQTTVATVPSGSVIATDDAGGVHFQKVKLVDGTDGSTALIGGDATNGLDVDVTRVQGTVAVTQSGTWDEVGINDSGNSITVDGTVSVGAITAGDNAIGRVKITDGTDVALVTSDGNLHAITPDRAATGTIDALNESVDIDVSEMGAIYFTITGTWSGTLSFQVATDGSTFLAAHVTDAGTYDDATSTTANTDGWMPTQARDFRVKATAWTSGSAVVTIWATQVPSWALRPSTEDTESTSEARVASPYGDAYPLATIVKNDVLGQAGPGTEASALRVTVATDSTGVLSVDDNGSSLTVDAADGTVFVRSASASNFPVNVGRVSGNVTSVGSGTIDTGTQRVVLPTDQPAVAVSGTVAVTGVATAANQTTEITALQIIDDWDESDRAKVNPIVGQAGVAANTGLASATTIRTVTADDSPDTISLESVASNTAGPSEAVQLLGTGTYTEAVSKGMTIGAVRRDADTTLVGTTNEFGPLQMDANGRLKVEAFSGETLAVSLTSTTITGTVAVTDNSGSLTVDAPIGTPVNTQIGNGTLTAGVVDETGSSAVDAVAVGGGTPHDSVDSGNPQKVGWKAANALPTAVANADRANGISDLFGRQMVTHIDPAQQVHTNKNYTSTQTGTDVIDPAGGKKIAVTSVLIGTYGTTAGRIILWFGDNADTTFTQDTDQVLVAFSAAPSATSKPGLVFTPPVPVFCTTADRELHVTTDANISFDLTIESYEW